MLVLSKHRLGKISTFNKDKSPFNGFQMIYLSIIFYWTTQPKWHKSTHLNIFLNIKKIKKIFIRYSRLRQSLILKILWSDFIDAFPIKLLNWKFLYAPLLILFVYLESLMCLFWWDHKYPEKWTAQTRNNGKRFIFVHKATMLWFTTTSSEPK